MNEFEQCLLMTLKDIKSQLNGINDGLYSISNQLKQLNESYEEDWTYNIHTDLQKIGDSLEKIYQIQDERL